MQNGLFYTFVLHIIFPLFVLCFICFPTLLLLTTTKKPSDEELLWKYLRNWTFRQNNEDWQAIKANSISFFPFFFLVLLCSHSLWIRSQQAKRLTVTLCKHWNNHKNILNETALIFYWIIDKVVQFLWNICLEIICVVLAE